jgi:hypothetical protein
MLTAERARLRTLDTIVGTIALPLYQGQLAGGRPVLVHSDRHQRQGQRRCLGLNYSTKRTYAEVGNAIRTAPLEKDATLTFVAGTVDVSPERTVVPSDGVSP